MQIREIKVSNFKSFKDARIQLGRLTVLIGANASGKSNFVQVFRFLRDVENHDLNNAISLQGGVEYLRNINIGSSKELTLEVSSDTDLNVPAEAEEQNAIAINGNRVRYKIAIDFPERVNFRVVEDEVMSQCTFFRIARSEHNSETQEEIGTAEISLSNESGRLHFKVPEGAPVKEQSIFPTFLRNKEIPSRSLLLENHFFHIPVFFPSTDRLFGNLRIYDFDPRLSKRAAPITSKTELEEDGSNVATALERILEDDDKARKLHNLTNDLLSFVDDWEVARSADKSVLFKLRETYNQDAYIPAAFISDGTINILALIIALYFEEKPIIVIEEPERNLHPSLLPRLVEMLQEASINKQIIVTTQSAEIVRHADLADLLFITRNAKGYSEIYRPGEKEEVKTFLQNEVGIEDLYIQNLLGV